MPFKIGEKKKTTNEEWRWTKQKYIKKKIDEFRVRARAHAFAVMSWEKRSAHIKTKTAEQWVNEMRRASAIATHKMMQIKRRQMEGCFTILRWQFISVIFLSPSLSLSLVSSSIELYLFDFSSDFHSFVYSTRNKSKNFVLSFAALELFWSTLFPSIFLFFFHRTIWMWSQFEQEAKKKIILKQSVCCLFCNRRRDG